MRTPPPSPRDDLRLSNATAILQNPQICLICILSSSHYVMTYSLLLDCEQSLFSQSSLSSAVLASPRLLVFTFARFARFPRSRDHPEGLLAVYPSLY